MTRWIFGIITIVIAIVVAIATEKIQSQSIQQQWQWQEPRFGKSGKAQLAGLQQSYRSFGSKGAEKT